LWRPTFIAAVLRRLNPCHSRAHRRGVMAGRSAQHAAAVWAERVVLEFDAFLACVVALRRVPLVPAEAVERLQPPRAVRELVGVSNGLWRVAAQI
jgi:hypothetical protein